MWHDKAGGARGLPNQRLGRMRDEVHGEEDPLGGLPGIEIDGQEKDRTRITFRPAARITASLAPGFPNRRPRRSKSDYASLMLQDNLCDAFQQWSSGKKRRRRVSIPTVAV